MTKEEREKAIEIFIKRAKCRATSTDDIIEGTDRKCSETTCDLCPLYYEDDELYEAERTAIKELKQEPCEDAISRQAVLDATVKKNSAWNAITNANGENLEEIINSLPNVTPARKHGEWERGYSYPDGQYVKCLVCGEIIKCTYPMHFCPSCGADMRKWIKESKQ